MKPVLASILLVLSATAPASLAAAPSPAAAIIDAATKGDVATVRTLLDDGIDPNIQNDKGVTALDFAAANDRLDTVRLLIARHATVDLPSDYGATALMYGSGGGASPAVIAALLAGRASVNARDKEGLTALAFAAKYQGRGESAAILIDKGADIEAQTRNFDRPLSLAAESGRAPMIGELLKHGANPGFALVWEVYHKRPAAVRALIDAGVDVNAPYPNAGFGADQGTTALVEAASSDDLATARLLIDHGANVNAVVPGTSNMPTALTFAAYHCNADMIALLLDHGADRSFRNASGNSAADLARTGWTNDMQACSTQVQGLLR